MFIYSVNINHTLEYFLLNQSTLILNLTTMIYPDQISFSMFLLFIIVIVYLLYFKRKTSHWHKLGIPGPAVYPIIGTQHLYIKAPLFEVEHDLVKSYGRFVGLYENTTPLLLLADPSVIKQICHSDFNIFPESLNLPYLPPIASRFIAFMYGRSWKRLRTLTTQAFKPSSLRTMVDMMKLCIDDRLMSLEKELVKGETIDLKKFWGEYTMDIIGRSCFSLNLNLYSGEKNKTQQAFQGLFDGDKIGGLVMTLAPAWFTRLTKSAFMPEANLIYTGELARTIVETRKKQGQDSPNDFLQFLIDAENTEYDDDSMNTRRLTIDEIISTICLLMLAGYETTSTSITWTCYELAMNPEIQEAVYSEINQIEELSYDSLNSLPYLDAVINEVLRLHPPIAQTKRVCHQDYCIPGTNISIPKGTKIQIPIYAIHHDPELFSDSDKFCPERFLPGNKNERESAAFLPFGIGPKTCIGTRFALLNIKYALVSILKRYKFIKNSKTTEIIKYRKILPFLTPQSMFVGIVKRI